MPKVIPSALTFEQQKEMLMLQHQHTLECEEKRGKRAGSGIEKVKITCLSVWSWFPKGYREKFRVSWKQESQTYVAFVRELTTLFKKNKLIFLC